MSKQVTRLVASSFGLVAFALAVVVGLSVGNPTDAILSRALVSLILAAFAGYAFGMVMEHLVKRASHHVEARADEAIAEEEAALYAALHPERAGDGHGAHAHHASAGRAKAGAARAGDGTALSGGAGGGAQPVVAGAGART